MDWHQLSEILTAERRQPVVISDHHPVGGGCIHAAFAAITQSGERFFVKTNDARHARAFACERTGLEAIAATAEIRVPRVVAHGVIGESAFLVLEHLEIGARGSTEKMGRQLARMHRHLSDRFGWVEDNFIGATPQSNGWTEDWGMFFRDHRLRPQIFLARENGLALENAEKLLDRLPSCLVGHTPQPSLLHGDLWGGNVGFTPDGSPLVFDPASYYGDRETDIAMAELFGGFDDRFHEGYNDEWPLDAGYRERKPLYNLYHILNHANLFGGTFCAHAQRLIDQLLDRNR